MCRQSALQVTLQARNLPLLSNAALLCINFTNSSFMWQSIATQQQSLLPHQVYVAQVAVTTSQ
jgi:hypothetical protein